MKNDHVDDEKLDSPANARGRYISSDTPETDTEEWTSCDGQGDICGTAVDSNFARKLERERDELRAAVINLRNVQGRYHAQIAAEQLFSLIPDNAEPIRAATKP